MIQQFQMLDSEFLHVDFTDTGNRWKSPQSIFRTKWDLKAIPTLIKYTRTEDGISQKQVVENDVKDEGQLKALVQS